MPRYKPQERNGLLVPVVLSEQLVVGSFGFALQHNETTRAYTCPAGNTLRRKGKQS